MACNRFQGIPVYKYLHFCITLIPHSCVMTPLAPKSPYLTHFLTKSLQTKHNLHHFQFFFKPTDQNPLQHLQMTESSKKRKGSSFTTTVVGHRRQGTSEDPPAPIPPSLSSPRSSTLFSSNDQHQRYYSQFCNRVILDLDFFYGETFYCYQVFQNSALTEFMSLKLPYFLELVRVIYNNLKIQDGIIYSEVHNIPIIIDQSLFFPLTKLPSQGVHFEGTIVDD